MAVVTIADGISAWTILERCLRTSDAEHSDQAAFSGWPTLEIAIRPGDGTGTPEIVRALSLLEKAVFRAFAIYKFGSPDVWKLTRQDRHQLAPVWRVQPGSTKLVISLARAAAHFMGIRPNRMTGNQQVQTVICLGLLFCATASFAATLYFSAEIEKERVRVDCQTEIAVAAVDMTREHTEQMRLLKAAYDRDTTKVIYYAASDIIPWRPALLEMAPFAGTLTINQSITIEAVAAKAAAKSIKSFGASQKRELANNPAAASQIGGGWITTVRKGLDLPPPMRLGA